MMCEVAGRESQGWLRVEDIKNFPCEDLKIIDLLWVEYSHGKFGFSVQKQIWQGCGSPTDYNAGWEQFGDRVGWRRDQKWINCSDVTFDTKAPRGHLPLILSRFMVAGAWVAVFGKRTLFSRAQTCEV